MDNEKNHAPPPPRLLTPPLPSLPPPFPPSDWDAGAEAPPDPSLWEADWDDDAVADDEFGRGLAAALEAAPQ